MELYSTGLELHCTGETAQAVLSQVASTHPYRLAACGYVSFASCGWQRQPPG